MQTSVLNVGGLLCHHGAKCVDIRVDVGLQVERRQRHVPAHAIRRLLDERRASAVGLAVPGTPGMELPRHDPVTYDVVAWSQDSRWRPWPWMRGIGPA